jgi:phosphohistidine phosphatase
MPKTALLLRHAQAARRANGDDHARPLTDHGRTQASRVGQFLAATHQRPEQVVASSARRTQQTAEAVVAAFQTDGDSGAQDEAPPISSVDALYRAQAGDVLAVMQKAPITVRRLLLVGHQPAWSAAISRCVGEAALDVPPGTIARVDFKADTWDAVAFGEGVLAWLLPPSVLAPLG